MARIVVDYDLCEANAVCEAIAPEVFHVDEEDQLQLLQSEFDEDLRDEMEQAVLRCPKQALSIEE